jgi:hypothetical protein
VRVSLARTSRGKLLEDALIKLSTVATDIFGRSGRDMIEALIAGKNDPKELRWSWDFAQHQWPLRGRFTRG